MTTYIITLTVGLDRPVDDEVARDVAASWAHARGLEVGMTSTARDEGWLRVAAMFDGTPGTAPLMAGRAPHTLGEVLDQAGHTVTIWHAVEVLTDEENTRRAQHRGIPPLVDAQTFADLCGVRRQRVYQWVTDRPDGFPPQLDQAPGYWLRTEAEHWSRIRPTRPGPAARTTT